MAKLRIERINAEIQKAISETINNELNDPRLDGFMVTVNKCETTEDLYFCKIYISIFPSKDSEPVLNALKHSLSFIRKRVSQKVLLRHTPELSVVVDNGLDYMDEIDKLIKKINEEKKDKINV